jgi:hypothetical protein
MVSEGSDDGFLLKGLGNIENIGFFSFLNQAVTHFDHRKNQKTRK